MDGVATDRYFPNTFADYHGEDHLDSHREVRHRPTRSDETMCVSHAGHSTMDRSSNAQD